jgi:rubrerythrin
MPGAPRIYYKNSRGCLPWLDWIRSLLSYAEHVAGLHREGGHMDEKLKEAFHKVYEGESKAALRLKIFAKEAEKEELPQIARLFRVISFSEEIHGERALRILREINDTDANLKESLLSEKHVAGVAYDNFIKLAGDLKDDTASGIFSNSRDVEDAHAKLYDKAVNHLIGERETTYYVCKVCGYVSDGILPEVCPVCGASKEQFVEFK